MQPYFTDLALHPILALGWEQVPPAQQGTLPAEGIENQKEVKVTITCCGLHFPSQQISYSSLTAIRMYTNVHYTY